MGGVNPEVDGHGRYAFVGAGGAIRLRLDLLANLIEVCEFLPFAVEEFGPFCATRKRRLETANKAPAFSNRRGGGGGVMMCGRARLCLHLQWS